MWCRVLHCIALCCIVLLVLFCIVLQKAIRDTQYNIVSCLWEHFGKFYMLCFLMQAYFHSFINCTEKCRKNVLALSVEHYVFNNAGTKAYH